MSFGYQDSQLLCRSLQFPGKLSVALNPTASGLLIKSDQTTMLSLTRAGNMTVAGTLTVDGASTLTGDVTLSGALTVTGAQTFTGVSTFTTSPIFTNSAPPRYNMTITDEDAQNATLTIAEMAGGIIIHTTTAGGGTVTTDTAANIIASAGDWPGLTANGQCLIFYYINDGSQTATFAGGTNVTFSDTGNTVLTNESAMVIIRRTSATTCSAHII